MPLFLIEHDVDGTTVLFLQAHRDKLFARLYAAIAGLTGDLVSVGEVSAAQARLVPKALIGRPLTAKETRILLARLSANAKNPRRRR